MTTSWIVGAGGLIGTALRTALSTQASLFSVGSALSWQEPVLLREQLRAAFGRFESTVERSPGWEIYWAAGRGTMRSQDGDLVDETRALECLLDCVVESPVLRRSRGAFVFASSAGAIYAGAGSDLVSEDSVESPTTAYGRAKVLQEALIRRRMDGMGATRSLLARISTVYGPGQAANKPQGLITHIARNLIRNRPVHLYVPLDTIRDYIAVSDAAAEMVCRVRTGVQPGEVAMRLVASEHPTTISEIVALFRRLSRRSTMILTSAEPMGALYTRCLQFRSKWPPAHEHARRVSLATGVSTLLAEERLRYVRGC